MSDVLHIYEYALDKEVTTYTVWDAHQSFHFQTKKESKKKVDSL
nr:hypothetical protein [Bacillus cereus]